MYHIVILKNFNVFLVVALSASLLAVPVFAQEVTSEEIGAGGPVELTQEELLDLLPDQGVGGMGGSIELIQEAASDSIPADGIGAGGPVGVISSPLSTESRNQIYATEYNIFNRISNAARDLSTIHSQLELRVTNYNKPVSPFQGIDVQTKNELAAEIERVKKDLAIVLVYTNTIKDMMPAPVVPTVADTQDPKSVWVESRANYANMVSTMQTVKASLLKVVTQIKNLEENTERVPIGPPTDSTEFDDSDIGPSDIFDGRGDNAPEEQVPVFDYEEQTII
ncbi:MAG: hypothetical protein ACI9VM_000417 [Candidatus Azotimanducaceae bacterium]|jgi:hypothetical protein